MPDQEIYAEAFTIRASEVTPDGTATLAAICYLLQEVAGNNALELNFDISQLKTKSLTWILHRLHIKMNRFPQWRDTITIKTWPSGADGLRAYRDFLILDSRDVEIGRCLSYWLMLDLDRRRPIRIPAEIKEMAKNNPDHTLPLRKDRIKMDSNNQPEVMTFFVRQTDLDMNEHVNNVKYIEWAIAALDDEASVKEIDIEFRAECGMGDEIESSIINDQPIRHFLYRKNDNSLVALAKSNSSPNKKA